MDRVYMNYKDLEETYSNLWKQGSEQEMAIKSRDLLRERNVFKEAIRKMLSDWKKSATFNLTNESQNRIAWIGQATCAYCHGSTNGETKIAWGMLDDNQKNTANNVALECLSEWEEKIMLPLFYYMEKTA